MIVYIHCFSSLSRKLDVGWPRIEHFQFHNVQHCLCHLYTRMTHSKQTATSLFTSLVFSSQPKTMGMHVGHFLGSQRSQMQFWACTTIDAGRKEWGVRTMTIWRSLTVARMAGVGQSSAIHTYETKIKARSCILPC